MCKELSNAIDEYRNEGNKKPFFRFLSKYWWILGCWPRADVEGSLRCFSSFSAINGAKSRSKTSLRNGMSFSV